MVELLEEAVMELRALSRLTRTMALLSAQPFPRRRLKTICRAVWRERLRYRP
jgi:hypothetical protein